MPNLKERREPEDDLEVAARVMQTVERQISEYRTALEKVRLIRREFELDPGLSKRAFTDPEAMKDLLVERGVAEPLAYGMARRLKRSQDEREALLFASLARSDKERATIAADLHDGVVQGLSGASYSLTAAAERARDIDPDTAQVMADTAKDLRRWMRELRSLVVTITPPALHIQGLAASLADLAASLDVRGLAVTVDVSGTEQLDATTETLVYRTAQEAVRNIVRHSDASTVTLSVTRGSAISGGSEEVLVLRVRDDGRGFETGDTAARSRGSVGLELLSSIVTAQGGALTVESALGQGTELVLKVPLGPATAPPTAKKEEEHEQKQTQTQDIAGALQ